MTNKNSSESSKIPKSVIDKLEEEMRGVNFGKISLIVAIRDGRSNYRVEKNVSIVVEG